MKDNVEKIKKMREINAGYQGFQLTGMQSQNYIGETSRLLKDDSCAL